MRGIGVTTASKLIARKRPHLYPVNDKVVRNLVRPANATEDWSFVGAVHESCQDNGLQGFLADVRNEAELPADVPLLRIFDVLVWMEGKAQGVIVMEAIQTFSKMQAWFWASGGYVRSISGIRTAG